MIDRILSTVSLVVGIVAVAFGLFLAFEAPGALLEELIWFCSFTNVATGLLVLVWQLKGQHWQIVAIDRMDGFWKER
ncbi:hypothetical protein [Billgrantia desiderata]|uniref:hypothetical protein n=1 Tax=Billgrantia desiderata TaxID=52021 RepID=UPI001F23D741|nr:hypothetical protein [Halomonas desiderata]MCE8014387.1 hypothetical protein [Halomonas desiderata]